MSHLEIPCTSTARGSPVRHAVYASLAAHTTVCTALVLPAEELRSVSHLKNPQDQARLTEALGLARQLAVSYVGLTLYMDMFPQVSHQLSREQPFFGSRRWHWPAGWQSAMSG
mgnify:CR=1 FL=1